MQFLDQGRREVTSLRTGTEVRIEILFQNNLANQDVAGTIISLAFVSKYGQPLILCRNDYTGDEFIAKAHFTKAVCIIPNFPLMPGTYDLNLYAECKGEVLDWVQSAVQMEVIEGDFYGTGRLPPRSYGTVLVKHQWLLI